MHTQDNFYRFNDNIVAILIKMVSSTDAIKDDVILHWHVILGPKSSEPPPDDHKVATKFSVIADEVAAVVIVPKVTCGRSQYITFHAQKKTTSRHVC